MKVKDLIEYLTSVDSNLDVCIETNQGIFKTKGIYESCEPTITLDELKKRVTRYFTIG